jgi:uncharacterized protein YbjT (DUF2867 family)
MYVIAGAGGHTGRAAAESLLDAGRRIRVVVRDREKGEEWRARGAEVAVAALEDAGALSRALSGAEGAYLLVPPIYHVPDVLAVQRERADAIAEAISSSGLPHAVLLSSVAAHLSGGTGLIRILHYAEQSIRPAAKNLTILRPAYFMENWATVLGEAREKGVLPTFLTPGRPIATIATRDVGRAAARALQEPATGTRVVELSGPKDRTPEDVAQAVGICLGREVRILGLPIEAAVPAMTSFGMSENAAALYQEMIAGVNAGRIDFEGERTPGWQGTLDPIDALGPILDAGGSEGV